MRPWYHSGTGLLLALFTTTSVTAAVSSETLAACVKLFEAYPKQLVWDPLGPKGIATVLNASIYQSANTEYWNAESSNNRAACLFLPGNAHDVSFAVKTLNAHPTVAFALKSGGHNPNLGFSSVDEGVLISFRPNSQYAIPAADQETVEVGAGAKWEDVYAVLQPLNKAAVGGRLGDIGVTGFTIGGGLSYLSSQYGMACDNVVNFECVLANGTIVNANATSHPELFFALRGGGNQYAVITKMTLKTHNIGTEGMVWGGTRFYTADKHPAVLSAVSNFTANNKDPKAALIPTFNFIGAAGIDVPAIVVFYFYDAAQPAAGIFDELDAIHELSDGVKTLTYEDLTKENNSGKIEVLRFQIRMNTFPNMPMPKMSTFLNDHFTTVEKATATGSLLDPLDLRLFTFTVQPMSHLIAQASQNAGSNALGLDPTAGDRVWMEYDIAWLSPLCDEHCPGFVRTISDSLHNMHEKNYPGVYPTNYKSGNLKDVSYKPIFMNDAMYDQRVLQSYGEETYQRLKATHSAYDLAGFFATRQKGFGFTN